MAAQPPARGPLLLQHSAARCLDRCAACVQPKNPEALDDAACERLYNETEKILQEFY